MKNNKLNLPLDISAYEYYNNNIIINKIMKKKGTIIKERGGEKYEFFT